MRFEKVSFEEFAKDMISCAGFVKYDYDDLKKIQCELKLPERSTSMSAGYDFFSPITVRLGEKTFSGDNDYVLLPTGIRFICEPHEEVFLMCVPRSGLGFKKGVRLRNTVGIIDADYCWSDNEGHIMAKLGAESDVEVEQGKAFMQGIILPFYKTDNDDATATRNGGFGSTDKNKEDK